MKQLIAILVAALGATACSVHTPSTPTPPSGSAMGWNRDKLPLKERQPEAAAVLRARIYRTNADVAAYVPVTVSPDGKTLLSYPAPTDVDPATATPVALPDGWLLDRRGVGGDTRFTRWTYAEYSALPAPPSPAEILGNLIPGVRVSQVVELPFAAGSPDAVTLASDLIAAGLPDCRVVWTLPEWHPGEN